MDKTAGVRAQRGSIVVGPDADRAARALARARPPMTTHTQVHDGKKDNQRLLRVTLLPGIDKRHVLHAIVCLLPLQKQMLRTDCSWAPGPQQQVAQPAGGEHRGTYARLLPSSVMPMPGRAARLPLFPVRIICYRRHRSEICFGTEQSLRTLGLCALPNVRSVWRDAACGLSSRLAIAHYRPAEAAYTWLGA